MRTQEEIVECYRLSNIENSADGGRAVITFPKWQGSVVWSNVCGWDHVSVSPFRRNYTPTWEDMCMLNGIFCREDEWTVEFHPSKDEYVNNMKNCLHIWKPQNEKMPTPPWWMVGIKKGKTMADAIAEMDKYEKENKK